MRSIGQFLKKNTLDVLLILVLLILVYAAWIRLPEMTIRGDGYLYMLSANYKTFFSIPYFYTGFENSAMMFGFLLPKLFGVNLPLYYWSVLIVMFLIDLLFYVTVKLVTKKSIVAFAASLIFAVNYFGLWDMISIHCYCFFLERIIPTTLLIPSFIFLHLFLEKGLKKFLIASFLFYFFGVGIGHFTVLFTPFFLLYPIFWYVFRENKMKRKLIGFVIGVSYLFQSAFFIAIQQVNESGLGPQKWTFFEFLLDPGKFEYVKKILLQFVYWTQYPILFLNYEGDIIQSIVIAKNADSYIPYFIIAYLLAAVCIYLRLPYQRPMLFTTLAGVVINFFLNSYFNQYDILNHPGSNRYLFFSTFLLAIFWSYVLWALFWQAKNFFIFVGIVVLCGFYLVNALLIEADFIRYHAWNRSTRAIMDYIIETRDKSEKKTVVVVSYPEFGSQESTFFTEQLGRGDVSYISENNLYNAESWEKAASSAAKVIRVYYDANCDCVKETKLK